MTDAEKIDEACFRLMMDPALQPLRDWWEAQLRGVFPAGPIDPLRLAMAQGDRERLLVIMQRAYRHKTTMERTS